MSDIQKAIFTKFEPNTNWCDGKIGPYNFQAKLFDEGSIFGIENGRVSKLFIWDQKVREAKQDFTGACVIIYDRGWDESKQVTDELKPYFDAVMELLENAPKRFED